MKIVIIGNSAAGSSAANILAGLSGKHEITVISEELHPAYRKDRLLDYLSGSITRDLFFSETKDFYTKNRINFLSGCAVTRVDTKKKTVVLKDKNKVAYGYLIIASGKKTSFPDLPGKTKDGILGFYNFDDAQNISERLALANTACISAGKDISLKLAGVIAAKGKEVKVIGSGAIATADAQPENIELIPGAQLQEFIGEGSQLQAIKLSSGKVIAAPLAIITGNYAPSSEFLKDSGIVMSDGYIVVDDLMRTSVENVFACGSIAVKSGSLPKDKTWQQATEEGAAAGCNLLNLIDGSVERRTNMPGTEILIDLGTKGADVVLGLTQEAVDKAIKENGPGQACGFPETNYFLPLINALLKIEVKTLAGCLEALQQAQLLAANKPAANGFKIEALGGVLNKGIATLICEEILACLKYSTKEHPQAGFAGFLSDTLLRSLGIQLVDGRIAGIAVILGPGKDEDSAVRLVRDFQNRSIVSILVGNVGGNSFKKQLEAKNIILGLENYIVPLGEDYLSAIYAVNWAIRAPLMYGGHKSGQWQEILKYTKEKVPAFVVLLGHVDEVLVATGLGVLAVGFPIISDLDLPQLGKIDTTLYEALVTEKDYTKLAGKCIEVRGLKVKVSNIDIPVPYAAAFEGERVRREQLYVEFGGKASSAFEYLTTKDSNTVEDGKVEIIGQDIDQLEKGKRSLPMAIIVEVAGRKMQKDFEPILERQIHRFVNYAMGIMHVGQRDMNWIRISQDTFNKGFRLKHLGVILHAMLHQEYSAIVDKVQVKIYTKQEDVDRLVTAAQKTFGERDERLSGMTDESVDVFYSCLLCQSFAPNHVCIVTPERLGLCGAYSWLDAKASYEIIPTGPNQPIAKGSVSDSRTGQWPNINDFVYNKSNKTVEKVSMYSLMDAPQSSCGCFECIVAVIPEANGVMIVHRDFSGMTPSGMTFTTLAGSVGGGVQTPGFLGIGKLYIVSNKFIAAEGGLRRVVWMPKELKEILADKLQKRAEELGDPGLISKIADETVTTTAEGLTEFLQKAGHPALTMEPLI